LRQPIINQIENWVSDILGWTPIDQLYSLYLLSLSSANVKGDILEVGSWCGRSSVVLGKASEKLGDTHVYCVDLFPNRDDWYENDSGDFSFSVTIDGHQFGGYQSQTVWRDPYINHIKPVYELNPNLLATFKNNMNLQGVSSEITPFKGDINLFLDHYLKNYDSTPSFKLIFLDGDHGYEAVRRDIITAESVLSIGGWIVFDDAFSHYDGVNKAIEELIISSDKFNNCQQVTRKCFIAQKSY
jgi:predicted O-methyltransferase YrrM